MWSVQTGRLLEVRWGGEEAMCVIILPPAQLLTGHEGPVSCVAFSPSKALLVSGSWDNTVRLWDVFEHKGAPETLTHSSNGMSPVICASVVSIVLIPISAHSGI